MRKSPLPWFPLHVDLPDHAKSLRLSATLGEHNAHVYPLNLWCWAAQHAPDGHLKASTIPALIRMVEDACRWRGAGGKLFRALVEVRFIDTTSRPVRSVFIHNWDLICGAHLRAAERHAERNRLRREALKRAEMQAALAAQDDAAGGPDRVAFEENVSAPPETDRGSVNRQASENTGVKLERARSERATSAGRAGLRAGSRGERETTYGGRFASPLSLAAVPTPLEAVVVAGSKKRSVNLSNRAATTSAPLSDDFEGAAVDAFGFELRSVDIAGDLLQTVLERVGEARSYGLQCYALGVDSEALDLGVENQNALEFAVERFELVLLEALHAVHPELGIRWKVASKPPPRPAPKRWTLDQCVRWLNANGLKGGAAESSLRKFWKEAQHVSPAELMDAARDYRGSKKFAENGWPLAVFISEKVWKSRCPTLCAIAVEAAERVTR